MSYIGPFLDTLDRRHVQRDKSDGAWEGNPMSERRCRSVLVAVAVLAIAGCGGGSSDRFPDNTLELNGGRAATTAPVEVTYDGYRRWIYIYDVTGAFVELAFDGQGDPAVTADELPLGEWVDFDSEFLGLTICEPQGGGAFDCRTYDSTSSVSGRMVVVGDPSTSYLSFGGGFGLNNGVDVDEVIWSFTGSYTYTQD
jgi:hypothetical protein